MRKEQYLEDNLIELQSEIRRVVENQDIPEEIKQEIRKQYEHYEEILSDTFRKTGMQQYLQTYSNHHLDSRAETEHIANNRYIEKCEEKAQELRGYVRVLQEKEGVGKREKEQLFIEKCEDMQMEDRNSKDVIYAETIADNIVENLENCKRTMMRFFEYNNMRGSEIELYYEEVNELIRSVNRNTPYTIQEILAERTAEINMKLEQIYEEYLEREEKIEEKDEKGENTFEQDRKSFVSSLEVSEDVKENLERVRVDEKEQRERQTEEPEKKPELYIELF